MELGIKIDARLGGLAGQHRRVTEMEIFQIAFAIDTGMNVQTSRHSRIEYRNPRRTILEVGYKIPSWGDIIIPTKNGGKEENTFQTHSFNNTTNTEEKLPVDVYLNVYCSLKVFGADDGSVVDHTISLGLTHHSQPSPEFLCLTHQFYRILYVGHRRIQPHPPPGINV